MLQYVVALVYRSWELTLRCPVGFFFIFVRVSVSNAAEESVDICGSRASNNKTAKSVAAVVPVTVRLDFSQSDEFRTRVGSIVRKSANAVPHKSGMSFVCSRFSRPLSTNTHFTRTAGPPYRRFPDG